MPASPGRPARLTTPQMLLIVVVGLLLVLLAVLLVQRTGGHDGARAAVPSGSAGSADSGEPSGDTRSAESTPQAGPTYFAAPSGNIACAITADSADCVIDAFSYQPKDAADCDRADAGHHLRVEPAGATMPCDPLVVAGDVPNLPYGESVSAHGFSCQSEEDGVTCRADGSGYGFTVARGEYELF